MEIFDTLREAQVLIEGWRRHYNAIRPHSALGWKPPAPETIPGPAAVAYVIDGLQPRRTSAEASTGAT